MVSSTEQEREELREVVRGLLEDRCDETAVRELMETEQGYDPEVWEELGAIGVLGLLVPEEDGGSGVSVAELAVVFEELGRCLACVPYLSTCGLALPILSATDADAPPSVLSEVASGRMTLTLAHADTNHPAVDGQLPLQSRARSTGDGYTVTGTQAHVVDGHTADLLLIPARAPEGPLILAVEGEAAGVSRSPESPLDLTRKLATIRLDEAPGRVVAHGGAAERVLRRGLAIGRIALAAEAVGGAQRCLELSVEHASTRFQFGRPVGSFQAVKHRCARMLIAVELARALLLRAVEAAVADDHDLETWSQAVLERASRAFYRAAADTIQVHGGIGFTWEHPAHLYFKRATSTLRLLGDPSTHRERLAPTVVP